MNNAATPRNARRLEIAMRLLHEARRAVDQQQPLDAFLARVFRENRQFGSKDRKFYAACLFAWFRWHGLFARHPECSPEEILAFCHWLDANPNDPAFTILLPEPPETINLPLSEKIKSLLACHPALQPLDPASLLPDWIFDALPPLPSDSPSDAFLEGIQQRPPTWLRLPTQHAASLLPRLKAILPDAETHPACPDAVSTRMRFDIRELHTRIHPALEIQDLASQSVGLICHPQPGETWWDVCAASGGKALHLADLMHPHGNIVATDIRSSALRNLRQRAERARIRCIHTAHTDITMNSDKTFNGILVDAPCSGIGTWGRNPDARCRLQPDDIRRSAETQCTLLDAVLRHLAPGAPLIYSVCTLTRSETTDQIHAFLQRHPEYALHPFPHPLSGAPTDGSCFILPQQAFCNGMFIARIQRT